MYEYGYRKERINKDLFLFYKNFYSFIRLLHSISFVPVLLSQKKVFRKKIKGLIRS